MYSKTALIIIWIALVFLNAFSYAQNGSSSMEIPAYTSKNSNSTNYSTTINVTSPYESAKLKRITQMNQVLGFAAYMRCDTLKNSVVNQIGVLGSLISDKLILTHEHFLDLAKRSTCRISLGHCLQDLLDGEATIKNLSLKAIHRYPKTTLQKLPGWETLAILELRTRIKQENGVKFLRIGPNFSGVSVPRRNVYILSYRANIWHLEDQASEISCKFGRNARKKTHKVCLKHQDYVPDPTDYSENVKNYLWLTHINHFLVGPGAFAFYKEGKDYILLGVAGPETDTIRVPRLDGVTDVIVKDMLRVSHYIRWIRYTVRRFEKSAKNTRKRLKYGIVKEV